MLYILDASALLNDPNFEFDLGHSYITTPEVFAEWKSFEVRHLVDNAIQRSHLHIQEANWKYLDRVKTLIKKHGFDRISYPDQTILALALEFLEQKKSFQVLTDDYSIQNFLAILKIPFSSVFMEEIHHVIKFQRSCTVCGKLFSDTFSVRECDFCGGKIRKKPVQLSKVQSHSLLTQKSVKYAKKPLKRSKKGKTK